MCVTQTAGTSSFTWTFERVFAQVKDFGSTLEKDLTVTSMNRRTDCSMQSLFQCPYGAPDFCLKTHEQKMPTWPVRAIPGHTMDHSTYLRGQIKLCEYSSPPCKQWHDVYVIEQSVVLFYLCRWWAQQMVSWTLMIPQLDTPTLPSQLQPRLKWPMKPSMKQLSQCVEDSATSSSVGV